MPQKPIPLHTIDSEISTIVEKHHNKTEASIEILQEVQAKQGWLTPQAIEDIAASLKIPPRQVYGIATFYSMLALEEKQKQIVRVCDGPVCWLKRASETHQAIEELACDQEKWTVERTSCLGLCDRAPAILVNDDQAGPVSSEEAGRLCEGWRGVPTDYRQPRPGEKRVMLALTGVIDPDSIEDALAHGVYSGAQKALQTTPEAVLVEVENSGLQGRGGAGFPVGRKWRFVANERRTPRYVICNADESEPLIFKDRVLIDTNPHQLLEGLIIAGYACGASEAWIYIRGEYVHQAQRLESAIALAKQYGWLGENIQGSNFSFQIHVHRGAGAYICGEETALIESLEGKRGEPRLRPPYPPQSGFRGQPTTVNNVESFAAVPFILKHGAEGWKSISTCPTPGTKLYMVLGAVRNPGLFEAPFGLTLRQVIEEFGGGLLPGSEFNFALAGGAAGVIVPAGQIDYTIGYGTKAPDGSPMIPLGAGAFLVCDQTVSPVALLRELLHFFAVESCGKCTPCRVGTWHAHEILKRLAAGEGQPGDIAELKMLAQGMFDSSFCGLGQSVPLPMNSALAHFEQEFIHAEQGLVGG